MKSILTDDMEHCFFCGRPYPQIHHIFFGTANRKASDRYGMTVPLCQNCHTGNNGIHHNKGFDMKVKKIAQEKFEAEIGTREDFRKLFGKSYL